MSKKAAVLSYPDKAPAPFLVAKGKDYLAEKIIEIAEENSVPIIQNTDATEIISLQEIGSFIPEETYEILAQIFAFIKEKENGKN